MLKNLFQSIIDGYWYYRLKWSKKTPVFVFQMAKVGSSTVFFSIKPRLKSFLLHAHDFNGHHRLTKVRALFQYYTKEKPVPLKLISLVRDPINRNVSVFYQDFLRYNKVKFEDSKLNQAELKQNFLDHLKHEQPLVWLDRLYEHFGIDVYQVPFRGKDHLLMNNGQGVELLLFKHDLNNDRKAELLGEYLNIPDLKISNFNLSSKHQYGQSYKIFKKNLTLPNEYLDKMRQSKYYQHFYSKEEIEEHLDVFKEK